MLTRFNQKSPELLKRFLTLELFNDELGNLLEKLHFKDDNNFFFRHSWRGTLGALLVACQIKGIGHLLFSCPTADSKLWVETANICQTRHSKDVQDALRYSEEARAVYSDAYQVVLTFYYGKFSEQQLPWVEELIVSLTASATEPAVQGTMYYVSDSHFPTLRLISFVEPVLGVG
jgi:hypothetical protein